MSTSATDGPQGPPAAAATPPAPPTNPTPRPQPLSTMEARFNLPPRWTLEFGRSQSDYTVRDFKLSIGNQDSLAKATYQQIFNLSLDELPITEDDFVRMWKTLILKRVQDVFETVKCQRSANFVRIIRNIYLPAPLADLIYSIGSFTEDKLGIVMTMVPPDQASKPENWWTADSDIIAKWILLTHRIQDRFVMKEFPSNRDVEGRALVLTTRKVTNGYCEIRSLTNSPTPADGMIRFLNDELFTNGYEFADCHLRMTDRLNYQQVLYGYLQPYCTGSRA